MSCPGFLVLLLQFIDSFFYCCHVVSCHFQLSMRLQTPLFSDEPKKQYARYICFKSKHKQAANRHLGDFSENKVHGFQNNVMLLRGLYCFCFLGVKINQIAGKHYSKQLKYFYLLVWSEWLTHLPDSTQLRDL